MKKSQIVKEKPEEKKEETVTETVESITAETDRIVALEDAKIRRNEVKGKRDLPEVLEQREKDIIAKEAVIQERENAVAGKEAKAEEREDILESRETTLAQNSIKLGNEIKKKVAQAASLIKDAEEAVMVLNRYIGRGRLSNYCNLEEKLNKNDIAILEDSLKAIKLWRKW